MVPLANCVNGPRQGTNASRKEEPRSINNCRASVSPSLRDAARACRCGSTAPCWTRMLLGPRSKDSDVSAGGWLQSPSHRLIWNMAMRQHRGASKRAVYLGGRRLRPILPHSRPEPGECRAQRHHIFVHWPANQLGGTLSLLEQHRRKYPA